MSVTKIFYIPKLTDSYNRHQFFKFLGLPTVVSAAKYLFNFLKIWFRGGWNRL